LKLCLAVRLSLLLIKSTDERVDFNKSEVKILNEKLLVRKRFMIALTDLERLNQHFDSQFEVSDYLRLNFEEAYKSDRFIVSYKMPRSVYAEARVQRTIFFEKETLQKYNNYVSDTFKLSAEKTIQHRVSKVFTSLTHELAKKL